MEIEKNQKSIENKEEYQTKTIENPPLNEEIKRRDSKKLSLKDLKNFVPERSFRDKRRNTVS